MNNFLGLRANVTRTAAFLSFIVSFGLCAGGALYASRRPQAARPSVLPAQMTVTAIARHGGQAPVLTENEISVMQGHQSDPIVSWVPAQGEHAGMQLLLLIDDSDRLSVATQLPTLQQFIMGQPTSTQVGVGYMYNGLVHMAQPFTSNRQADVAALHLPIGAVGAASPYFSLMDMYKRNQWRPDPEYPRRVILMISDGTDPYNRSAFPQDSYVSEAAADMQQAGIQVFSIFTPGVASRHGGYQGGTYLMQISKKTGGYCLYSGLLGTAVDFTPYLNTFNAMLQHQYSVSFQLHPERHENMVKVKVQTSVPDVELLAPQRVLVPGAED